MSARLTPKRRAALGAAGREAEALKKEWKEALQHHNLRLEAQFKEVARRTKPRAQGKQSRGLPSAKQAESIRAILASVRVKAGKGRAKDLRRIEKALSDALDKFPAG